MSNSSTYPRRRTAPRTPRPPKYGYDFRNLLDFPSRLLYPPNPTVGFVRSLKVTPIFEVNLNDVLDGKHLPPLTLKDFEDYLVFEEHSVENLYFICWYRDYTARYNKWKEDPNASTAVKDEADLTISYARARSTFFDPSSHLELNLPSDLTENLGEVKGAPSPDTLSGIQKHVEGMLRESLMRFVGGSCRNSGRRRGFFAIFVGAAAILVGLAPVLMSVVRGQSRWVRLAALFPFWFGAMTAIAGFHGVCVVIFLFGDARQLYPYELARPSLPQIPPPAPLELPMPVTANFKTDGTSYAESRASDDDNKITLSSPSPELGSDFKGAIPLSPVSPSAPFEPNPSTSTSAMTIKGQSFDGFQTETAGFIPTYSASISQSQSGHSQAGSGPYKFDFDSLPSPSVKKSKEELEQISSVFRERSVFSSLTKVFSPLISRAQWEIVMRSAALGVLVALVIGGICFAVPFA